MKYVIWNIRPLCPTNPSSCHLNQPSTKQISIGQSCNKFLQIQLLFAQPSEIPFPKFASALICSSYFNKKNKRNTGLVRSIVLYSFFMALIEQSRTSESRNTGLVNPGIFVIVTIFYIVTLDTIFTMILSKLHLQWSAILIFSTSLFLLLLA